MSSGVDLLAMLNSSCSDCWDLGPPPDTILNIPPPPLPAFLRPAATANISAAPCTLLCDWTTGQGVEFVELTRQGAVTADTWLLVLISSSVGVLLLGSLLALAVLLLKCREERGGKVSLQMEGHSGKGGCEAVIYPVTTTDNRLLWATLTPRGGITQHLSPDTPPPLPTAPPPLKSFDNSAFSDCDDSLRRPRVSSPTRIEHPNLPPLNLHRTLRRNTDHPPIL